MKRSPQLGLMALAFAVASPCVAAPGLDSCRESRVHGRKAEAGSCYEALSRSADAYLRAEGLWGLQQYDAANEAFRQATSQPGAKAIYKVRWGLLLHERFNDAEASDLFHEALQQDPNNAQAYLAMAQMSADGFDSKAQEYTNKALTLDPRLAAAHELLAGLALENYKPEGASQEADKALALSGEALQAMAIHEALDVLADRSPDAWVAKIHAVNPHDGEGYAIVAHHLVLHMRFEDGVAYYRKAVEADPDLWPAHSQLGINLMRLGQEQEPLKQLELAYNHGQRDAATVNSLRLLDSYKNFVTSRDSTTILRLRKNEADLLRPYFEAELHKAMATYDRKYHMKLPGPVQVEVYPDHEDFAVRTMGMPGLGALGVTFGSVVAMDSPSGRKPGEFNWGATLWHELSHVYILQATNHRVPRWFTEGLAVHEEGQANAEWANRLTPEVLIAIRDRKLLPLSDLDKGFIFPEYPTQVIVSYYEAGAMCDYIAERWGEGKLLDIVHSYAALKSTPDAIRDNLKLEPAQFDKQYAAWLDQRTGKDVANFDAWRKGLKSLVASAETSKYDAVIGAAPATIKLYPEYVGDANAYEPLAAAQLAKGDKQGATATLTAYEKAGGESPDALALLASLEEELGQKPQAAATLARVNYIYPENEKLHRHLGELWLAQGNTAGAVREYTAVLALKPLDKASAEFELAQAYMAAGDKGNAEESVMAALEFAPGFRPAQKLLLQLEAGK